MDSDDQKIDGKHMHHKEDCNDLMAMPSVLRVSSSAYLDPFHFSNEPSSFNDANVCWIFTFCMALAEKLLMEEENNEENLLAYLYMCYGAIAIEKLHEMDIFHFLPWIYHLMFLQKLSTEWLQIALREYMGSFIPKMCTQGNCRVDVKRFFLNELYKRILLFLEMTM